MSRIKLIILLILFLTSTNADSNIVLKPVVNDQSLPEKMAIFIPGGKVPNSNYIKTAISIQEAATEIKLWIVIPSVIGRLCITECSASWLCSPLHASVESALSDATKKGWKRVNDKEDIFLLGHSLGGVCANTLMQAYSKNETNYGKSLPYKGLVVMGSYVDETGDFDLINYKVPVLTLNVELDGGLARPGKTSIWYRQYIQMIKDGKNETNVIKNKPVIILQHLNHSNFCPGFDVPGDLMAEVTQESATNIIGQMVASFFHIHWASNSKAANDGYDLLLKKIYWTQQLMAPYIKAQAMEVERNNKIVSNEGFSSLCSNGQHIIAGLSTKDDLRLKVEDGFHISSPNLEHCHPNYTISNNGNLNVNTCSHTDYYRDIDNTGEITAASEVACKFLSSERIAQQLKTKATLMNNNCADVNRYSVSIAESLALNSTLMRYKEKGRTFCFLPDVETFEDIGPLWVFKDSLKLVDNSTCLTVASASLKTKIDGKIYPGNTYCKVLSPARALDWMMTDSLKTK